MHPVLVTCQINHPEAHEVALQRVAWTQLRKRAKFTKVMSGWSKFSVKCDDGNTRSFYYHPEKGESQWDAPPEVLGLKEVPADPTGTICKHKIKWERCQKCKDEWEREQAAKVPPEVEDMDEKAFRKMYTDRARTQVLRQLGAWRECVDLETGNLFYHTPAEEEMGKGSSVCGRFAGGRVVGGGQRCCQTTFPDAADYALRATRSAENLLLLCRASQWGMGS